MGEARSSERDERNEFFMVSWTIENFRYVDKQIFSYLESPVFEVDSLRRTKWYLKLFPNDRGSEKVGVYIARSEDECNDSVFLNFRINILKEGKVLATSDKHSFKFDKHLNDVHGYSPLLKLNKILSQQTESRFDDDVLIQCEMWNAENDLNVRTDNADNNCHFKSVGKYLDLLYEFPSENFDILEDIAQIDQKYPHASNRCRIGTIINVKETELDFTLDQFSALQKNKMKMSVIKHAFSESFAVLISYINNDDVLQIDVLVKKTLSDYKSVHGHLSVRDIDNKPERSFHKVCYLEPEVIRKLSFTDVIKRSDALAAKEKLLDRDALNLHFVLTFVKEPTDTHTIYSTGSKSKVFQPNAQKNRISRQMEDIFVSRQHCDVTLRAGSQDISCHKAIVCHMSPVLDAMFTADMQEKNTGVVHVPDVDSETLNTLLRFMYTGEMDDMGVQEYMKLYVASDKYQVSSLTRECRKMLQEKLSVDNVCDVVLCADAHSDVTLKKCCMDFIRSNVPRVFSTDEWRSITEDNPKFASEVILYVTSRQRK